MTVVLWDGMEEFRFGSGSGSIAWNRWRSRGKRVYTLLRLYTYLEYLQEWRIPYSQVQGRARIRSTGYVLSISFPVSSIFAQ